MRSAIVECAKPAAYENRLILIWRLLQVSTIKVITRFEDDFANGVNVNRDWKCIGYLNRPKNGQAQEVRVGEELAYSRYSSDQITDDGSAKIRKSSQGFTAAVTSRVTERDT